MKIYFSDICIVYQSFLKHIYNIRGKEWKRKKTQFKSIVAAYANNSEMVAHFFKSFLPVYGILKNVQK